MHRHHIVPKRLGGSDDDYNRTPPISVKAHAEIHKQLWEASGDVNDFIAWKALAGRKISEKKRLALAKAAQRKSDFYRLSRMTCGEVLQMNTTRESCSKGGRIAVLSLTAWQRKNAKKFSAQCAVNGHLTSQKLCIPHQYLGVMHASKKELQSLHAMSNSEFYAKLLRGEIIRVPWQPGEMKRRRDAIC
jgi:hypothetical protein